MTGIFHYNIMSLPREKYREEDTINKQNKIKNLNEDYIKMIEKISIEKGYNITFDTLIKDTNKEKI